MDDGKTPVRRVNSVTRLSIVREEHVRGSCTAAGHPMVQRARETRMRSGNSEWGATAITPWSGVARMAIRPVSLRIRCVNRAPRNTQALPRTALPNSLASAMLPKPCTFPPKKPARTGASEVAWWSCATGR